MMISPLLIYLLRPVRRSYSRACSVSRSSCMSAVVWKKLSTGKATGPDEISARVLKECAAELAAPLTRLFSKCLRHGVQHSQCKIAHVVPVCKKSSHSKPNNYRPVSLLSIISKVMESIVNRQLTNHLDRHHLLSTRQYGFRRGLGTADLLTALQHEWAQASGSGGGAVLMC